MPATVHDVVTTKNIQK